MPHSAGIKNYCTVERITLATWPIDFLPINQLLCLPSYTNHFKTIKTKRISITFLAKSTLISANATFTLGGDFLGKKNPKLLKELDSLLQQIH